MRVAMHLRDERMLATLDHLGENVTAELDALAAREAYVAALRRIEAEQLDATVSVKLTALGLDLSEDLCRENARQVVAEAQRTRSRVEFDMESTAYTERTLRIVHDLHREFGSVRAVIQAYLYRSEADIRELNRAGIPVRLCKGAYQEPASLAWPEKADVDRNYLRLLALLLDEGTYPAIATHDEAMIHAAARHAREQRYPPEHFEYQMLLGVRRDLQRRVTSEGARLRIYVPYGEAWYPYFMRRLAERPANVFFLVRNLVRR